MPDNSEKMLTNFKAVRELIAVPERWTTGWYARDASGLPVFWNDETAVRFDLGGAIWKIEESDKIREEMVDYVLNHQDDRFRLNSLCVLQDKLGYESMLKMLDGVILTLDKELNPDAYKTEASTEEAVTVEVVKKKRGRPRKNPI